MTTSSSIKVKPNLPDRNVRGWTNSEDVFMSILSLLVFCSNNNYSEDSEKNNTGKAKKPEYPDLSSKKEEYRLNIHSKVF